MLAGPLLPIRLSIRPGHGSVEPRGHFLYLSDVDGKWRAGSRNSNRTLLTCHQDGGLYCDSDGQISKPFPNKPYCVDGTGSVGAKNSCGDVVAFCQTVLPGNEAMLIPTSVQSWAQLAVPGTSYWASTAAQYVLLLLGLYAAANVPVATTSTPQELESKMLASGEMDPNH